MKSIFAIFALLLTYSAAANPKVWKIAIISDMNQDYGSKEYTPALKAAIAHIRANGVQAVLSTGDMASGQKRGLDYPGMWKAFHGVVTQPLAQSRIPLLPSPGNHDGSAEVAFQEERRYYQRTWDPFLFEQFNQERASEDQLHWLPGVAQNYPLNYAVTMGPALFIALDATVSGGLVNRQLEWLETVLEKSGPYAIKIVFGHFPLFPFAFDRTTAYLAEGNSALAIKMESLLEDYHVNYFLSGHHHVYFPAQRLGHVRYVSVPLLGTGSRYLLTANRTERNRAPQAFLYFEFDASGKISMQALKSPSMTPITSDQLPPAISVPRVNASDCKGCANFPLSYFIESASRILYRRY